MLSHDRILRAQYEQRRKAEHDRLAWAPDIFAEGRKATHVAELGGTRLWLLQFAEGDLQIDGFSRADHAHVGGLPDPFRAR